jgi:peptide/nickel transport system substrate-binding protein
MNIHLRPAVKFHDGSPVVASTVAKALGEALPKYMGPAFADVDRITADGDLELSVSFRRPSPFLLEALEAPIRKPGASNVGTGPYMPVGPSSAIEMQSNGGYYLGAPAIDRIVVNTYPNVRSAWADMLRDKVDMLYETGVDALDSLSSARNVSLFTYVRHYQYVLIFNASAGPLRSREVRIALNQAIDRDALVRDALEGHALVSTGPIWPQHWAFRGDLPKLSFDPGRASATLLAKRTRFRCLTPPRFERLALTMKRQLESVGAEMAVQEAPLDSILQAMSKRDFDSVLLEIIGGPNFFRPYETWHSGGMGPGGMGSPQFEAALDRIRYASNNEEYGAAVIALQEAAINDPPGIFLVWPERARAVSSRFQVLVDPGRDILTTIRMWRPVGAEKTASRN